MRAGTPIHPGAYDRFGSGLLTNSGRIYNLRKEGSRQDLKTIAVIRGPRPLASRSVGACPHVSFYALCAPLPASLLSQASL